MAVVSMILSDNRSRAFDSTVPVTVALKLLIMNILGFFLVSNFRLGEVVSS